MDDENDHSYFRCMITTTTDRAYQVKLETPGVGGTVNFWVPKSLCSMEKAGGVGEKGLWVAEIESWFSKQEGME